MTMRNMRRGIPNLFKEGTRTLTGVEQVHLSWRWVKAKAKRVLLENGEI